MNIHKFPLLMTAALLVAVTSSLSAQELHARWDELTASDWPKALERSGRTCILPIGILEKHGPHAPIGSDLIQVREWAATTGLASPMSTQAEGQLVEEHIISQLVDALKAVKTDTKTLELQKEYFDRVKEK